ncbi:MAG: ABC transporter ATP-binding protein [Bacteroidales bacterium]|nr:ABC transporter ATP-binding protein [Bacteroidales bacterium]
MRVEGKEILKLNSLGIGYRSGKTMKSLLPPLNARAFEGELVAVIGKNGIGKSTLLKTIAGLLRAMSGSVHIAGKNISDYSRRELASITGYVSTEVIRITNMTVFNLVAMGRYPHSNWLGNIDKAGKSAILRALSRTGMSDFSGRLLTELSDGERQRAMIAMVLAQETRLIIMDEPTAFLDIKNKFEVIHLLKELSRKEGKTIVYSTHDFDTAVSQADKIWLILENELIEGAPEDMMIRKLFRNLFDTKAVTFNEEEGTFTVSNEYRGTLVLSVQGRNEYWTKKALARAGYDTVYSGTFPRVESESYLPYNWKFISNEFRMEFDTLYDLVFWLRHNDNVIY